MLTAKTSISCKSELSAVKQWHPIMKTAAGIAPTAVIVSFVYRF